MVGDDVDDTKATFYAIILEGFANAFEPLPLGLPLEWKMTHTIPSEPHGKPPFKPIY